MGSITETKPVTGTIWMWNGTQDNENDGWIDWGEGSTNINPPKDVPITLHDLRLVQDCPNYKKNGFELVKQPTSLTDEQFLDGDSPEGRKHIEDVYFPEVEDLVRKVTGAQMVYTYVFRVREQDKLHELLDSSRLGRRTLPAAHLDRDPETSIASLQDIYGVEETERLLAKYKRHAQVNVWRPISGPVQKWPLCFVDKSDVPDWSFETHIARVIPRNDPRKAFKNRTVKAHDSVLKNDPRYKYYYANRMGSDEAFVFSSYDSDFTKSAPHGTFWNDNDAEDAPPRRSIEVRSWVFFDN